MVKNNKFLILSLIFSCFSSFELQSKSIFSHLNDFNKRNLNSVKDVFNNFYTVDEGKLYRSKQLTADRFRYYIDKHNIKTIVNLRGENKDREWWQNENRVAREKGVKLINISMSAMWLPSRENLRKLLDIYADKSLYPILIHCQGGADRTGEAAAIYLLDQKGKSTSEALKQLSITYGHRSYADGVKSKDLFIRLWQGREWALYEYDPRDYPKYCRSDEYHKQDLKKVFVA